MELFSIPFHLHPPNLTLRLTNSIPPNFVKVGLGAGKALQCMSRLAELAAVDLWVAKCCGHQGECPSLGRNSGYGTGPLRPVSSPLCDSPEISDNHRHGGVPRTWKPGYPQGQAISLTAQGAESESTQNREQHVILNS